MPGSDYDFQAYQLCDLEQNEEIPLSFLCSEQADDNVSIHALMTI